MTEQLLKANLSGAQPKIVKIIIWKRRFQTKNNQINMQAYKSNGIRKKCVCKNNKYISAMLLFETQSLLFALVLRYQTGCFSPWCQIWGRKKW